MTAYENGWRRASEGFIDRQLFSLMPGYRNGWLAMMAASGVEVIL